MSASYNIGVDIGGTFTDCVAVDTDGNISLGKAPSTPPDFSRGVIDAVSDAARHVGLGSVQELLRATRIFFHACTVGENTLIVQEGAKTALVTTKGFADAVLMTRGTTTIGLTEYEGFHEAMLRKPDPLVPRQLIKELTERVDYKGAVLVPLDIEETRRVVAGLAGSGVESIAISLLWSIANSEHEEAVEALIRESYPDIFVTRSSELTPFVGEYERGITTILNAYVGPKISAYLQALRDALREKELSSEPLIMQAYGGVLGIDATCKSAVSTIESGPASGVVGTQFVGKLIGEENILATDMGGTTFKVSVIRNGALERDYAPVFMRYQLLTPKIWVESIGAGGGSIAWIDPDSNLLKVGPQGAGAVPGPVCYGVGGEEPTVSDADCVLGYLNPDYFLGGRMHLDKEAAAKAIQEKIADPLGMSLLEAASGIYRIANSHMTDLIRKATVERGYDPRIFTLFAYGGAAAVHAGRYAAELGVHQVVCPPTGSVHGATGLIASDVVYEYGTSDNLVVPADTQRVNHNFADLIERANRDLHGAGFETDQVQIVRSLDMRYRYQVHELNTSFAPGTEELTDADLDQLYKDFDEAYEQSYGKGSAYREAGREIVNFRVIAVGNLPDPIIRRVTTSAGNEGSAVKAKRDVYFEASNGFVETAIYDFDLIAPDAEVHGPAVIESPVTTIVVNPGDRATVDELRNIRLFIGG
ncbi:MAG: hydantoinase/oxoprolinase family protein [Chloroflexota bacterium]|nr:hydantoinase/oxoprolinase family protein [Chloroflexota bacterium]MDE2885649.1 hydantoinase/oxoprolinase family protein [Chloroflexota bacterium]